MRVLKLAPICLLIGAAPAETLVGRFHTWLAYEKAPIDFLSGGVRVHVEALPCPAHPVGDSTCHWEGFNNQAAVTVSAPGIADLSVITDRQSAYARVAVVRFERNDARPGVIIESQYGGSGGNMTVQLLIPSGDGYQAVAMDRQDGPHLQGQLADMPRDLSGDGAIDLKLEDGAFDSMFGCNACTPRPPKLFAVKAGKIVDESSDPTLRGVFAADMKRLAPMCLSNHPDRNGACAAYVADAARAGQFKAAWAAMLKHYERDSKMWQHCKVPRPTWTHGRCPERHLRSFPDALRAFLISTGYIPA